MKYLALLTCLCLLSFFGIAQDQCSEEDLDWMSANNDLLVQLGSDCGVGCAFAADPEQCVLECMQAETPLTDLCLDCFVAQVSCAQSNCFFDCVFGSDEACQQCITDNCLDAFNVCAGLYDDDMDGFTTLSDCDDSDETINPEAAEIWYDGVDQNCDGLSDFDQDMDGQDAFDFGGTDCFDTDAMQMGGAMTYYADADMDGFGDGSTAFLSCVVPPGATTQVGDCDDTNGNVYPEAPGTQEGLDNNCNGTIDPDEELICIADFNNDGSRNTPDLLFLLSEFNCIAGCTADLTGDDEVSTADLLAILAVFGSPCP